MFKTLALIALFASATVMPATSAQAAKSFCMKEAEYYADSRWPQRYTDDWWAAYDEYYVPCRDASRACNEDGVCDYPDVAG